MSIIRWGSDGSDIYVYHAEGLERGHDLVCCGCDDGQGLTAEEVLKHLAEHRLKGHHVPEWVDQQILDDLK